MDNIFIAWWGNKKPIRGWLHSADNLCEKGDNLQFLHRKHLFAIALICWGVYNK